MAELVVDHPGGVAVAEAGIFGENDGEGSKRMKLRRQVAPGFDALFYVSIRVDHHRIAPA
jgi:hypothetical protein